MSGADRFKPPVFPRDRAHGDYLRGLDREDVIAYYEVTHREDNIPLAIARVTFATLVETTSDPEFESSGPYLPNIPFGD